MRIGKGRWSPEACLRFLFRLEILETVGDVVSRGCWVSGLGSERVNAGLGRMPTDDGM